MSAPVPAPAETSATASSTPSVPGTPAPGEVPYETMAANVLAHRAVRAVIASLESSGVKNTVRVLPATAPTAATAAAQLGCPVGAIANSLVFEVAGAPLLMLTSGAHKVDTKALGQRIGVSRSAVKRAKPDDVKRATGQAIGGIAPVGHSEKIRTLVDEELRNYEVVWAAAGHHMAVYSTDFDTLVRITEGQVVKVD